uniref:Alpha-2-macroglobulin n=1 Tax=Pelusios castaneus TaxID=367368 RepID=A0A8C8VQ01_9SAUR
MHKNQVTAWTPSPLPIPSSLTCALPLPRQYMVLVPFLIHTKVPEKICIQLTHLNESVTLSATLEYAGENRSLIADVVSEKDTFKCFSFTVPMSSSQKAAFLTVLVKGPTLTFRSRKSVLVKNSESLVFVQTDKPIYKPGQTVLFRIVSLDEDFHPLNEKVGLDPQRNRVYQWREVELSGGLTQLSFPLTSEPIQGPYKVVVQKESGTSVEHAFAVEEYVLPKYEVLVMVPKTITIQDEELKVAVCGLYTYGTPVPGLVNVHVCRKFSSSSSNCYGREADAVCEEFTRQADIRGCVSNVVQTKIFQLKRKGYEMEIEVQGKITEEGTGVELTGTGSTEITGTMSKIIFEQVDSHYRPGIPFFGQVGTSETPGNYMTRVHLSVVNENLQTNHTTNEEGRVRFSIDTANFTDSSIHITVNHKSELNCYDSEWVTPVYDRAVHRAPQFYSPSKSFLRIEPMSQTLRCGSTVMVQVHYILKPEAIEGQKQTVFYYLVMAKGGIARAGTEVHPVGDGEVFQLRLPLGPDVAPLARLLVYITLPSGEVIASSEDFKIENCFANKVDLQFSPDEGLPASNTHLRVGASPGSLCAIRAVDKSVLLMKPEAELSPSSVSPNLSYPPSPNVRGEFLGPAPNSVRGTLVFPKPRTPPPPPPSSMPSPCFHSVTRSVGSADLDVTIPDTITEWKANAFCTSSDTGFGLSPTVSLRAFQPFFVELTLPYSVVRGEAFTLKATVFSYLTSCIRVSISLAPSTNFRATPVEKEEESYCLCVNGRKTLSWAVTPKSLGHVNFSVSAEALKPELPCGNEIVETPDRGRKDTVIKQLLVEVGGPLSDILGTAMQNLHQLLQMPFGCGEQNMALFAPNIYILDYLNKTEQLSEEIKSKAIGYLVSGEDGDLVPSLAAFQGHGGSCSCRLAQIILPEGRMDGLKGSPVSRWGAGEGHTHAHTAIFSALLSHCSPEWEGSGGLGVNYSLCGSLQGGVDDEVTLSAYITIALLEIPLPITHSVVRNALFCLETAAEQGGNHVYTRALLAYAFALAGKEEKRRPLLDSLDKEAVKEDGSIHWQRPGKQQEADLPFYRPRAPSAEVEMTSYVLLAYLTSRLAPSQEDLSIAAQIAKWISKQQNPNGGFSSTQDTVVALQALSQYGVSTYAKSGGASTVTVRSTGDFKSEFQVDHMNRLLLQRVALPEVPGEYSTGVTGEGCVYVQTSLRYNVLPKLGEAPFVLQVHTVPEICDSSKAHRTFGIAINVSYTGKRPVSNMAIVDVKMLSGFIPVKTSVRELEGHHQIHRTEVSTNHVLLYMEQVSNMTQIFSFTVEQDFFVQSLKPALVKVYDYYETDEFAIAEYHAPCSKGSI